MNVCVPPGSKAVPQNLEEIILRCLEKDANARPQHAIDIYEVLDQYLPRTRDTGFKSVPQLVVREDDEAQESDWCEVTGTFDKEMATMPSGEAPTISPGVLQTAEEDQVVHWERVVK